jgi:hypothetical protein
MAVLIPATVNAYMQLWLYQDGVSIGTLATIQVPAAASMQVPVRVARRLTPAAGSHTYSVRASVSTGSGTVYAGVGGIGVNVPTFIRISLASPLQYSPGALQPVGYGTTLPGAPLDGQEYILVDSVTNPTYQWRFRYNAGSTSAYKWEFIGGVALYGLTAVTETLSSTVYGDMPTVGPQIALPRDGDYLLEYGMYGRTGTASNNCFMTFAGGGVAAADGNAIQIDSPTANFGGTSSFCKRFNALTAGALTAKYRAATGTLLAGNRWMSATPFRVS